MKGEMFMENVNGLIEEELARAVGHMKTMKPEDPGYKMLQKRLRLCNGLAWKKRNLNLRIGRTAMNWRFIKWSKRTKLKKRNSKERSSVFEHVSMQLRL